MAGLIGALIISGASEGVDKYRSRRAMKRRATLPPPEDEASSPISYDEAIASSSSAASSPGAESSSMAAARKERMRIQDRHGRRAVDDVIADEDAPPPYNPPIYSERPATPSASRPHHINLNTTNISAPLPARPPPPRELGGIQRADGRRPCRVNSKGACECGKQKRGRSPGAPEKESEEDRLERKRKEAWSLKGGQFWERMSLGFMRGFVI